MTDTLNRPGSTRRVAPVQYVSLAVGGVALVLSAFTFASVQAQADDSEEFEKEIRARLLCLELDGPNDCGVDGLDYQRLLREQE
ncbi:MULTISPECIES: hypothetical protein [unclassified Nocardioides]|uniref:hypothetical protein n=1 Tax=unclassified Nocardioides TaxID=2615069 RepID=UPI0036196935